MIVQYRKKILFLFFFLFTQKVGSITNVNLQIEGITGDLQKNICARLSAISCERMTENMYFQGCVDNTIREGLRAFGYYFPTVDFRFKPASGSSRDTFIASIKTGKPVKIIGVNVILRGEAKKDKDYQKWVSDAKFVVGTVLNHGAYERFKNGFFGIALQKGYFDAKFNKSQLGVDLERYQAYWEIDFDSGQRYHFGKVRFHGLQICEDYLKNLTKVYEGVPYSADLLMEFNRKLVATNWFNSVVISPDFFSGKKTKILFLDAIVMPYPRNSLETSFGYDFTETGLRMKTVWSKPQFNSHIHSFQTKLNLSELEQLVDFSYKIPILQAPLEQYYFLQGGFKSENFNDIQSDSSALSIARYWNLANDWQRAISLRWSFDQFIQNNITDKIMLLCPRISVSRNQQYGGLMPSWGESEYYSVDVSNTAWRSNINFIILLANNLWIRTLADKHRFVARSNLGWIKTNNFKRIPPLLRFFAGGDHSIRGYQYKSLSPRNNTGQLTGASKLLTGSIEYQYNITNKWWGAVFFDIGEAVNNIKENNFKIGVGIGVRWESPFGPINLDVAAPASDEHEQGVQFYIRLGPEL